MVHLKSQTLDVIGGSIPGTPGVSAVGFNGQIAWSMVNGRVDELDYFIEKVHPENPDQYLTENGYEDFQVVEETLKIKTKAGIREEEFKVKVSRHGPIISEVMPLAPDHTAMKKTLRTLKAFSWALPWGMSSAIMWSAAAPKAEA